MNIQLEQVLPAEIERRSMEIIAREMGPCLLPEQEQLVLKRVIHTTADFGYQDSLTFSGDPVNKAIAALKEGAVIVTDTQMAKAGINKAALAQLGSEVLCFMSDPDVDEEAKERGSTRAAVCMERLLTIDRKVIVVVGNAPTALVRLYQLMETGQVAPQIIVGVPVGFVNVVESKELIASTQVPSIISHGRKGGSNVAAAICNAILYQATQRKI